MRNIFVIPAISSLITTGVAKLFSREKLAKTSLVAFCLEAAAAVGFAYCMFCAKGKDT